MFVLSFVYSAEVLSRKSKSYRLVSLLCTAAKILGRLILPELTEHLPIPNFQHGFSKNHSALNDLNHDMTRGLNQKKPAVELSFFKLTSLKPLPWYLMIKSLMT